MSDKTLLASMCRAIRHRGPDDTEYFLDGGVGLGIDRLSIIDLVTGNQPIHNEDGSLHLVFNGEIYNYATLRSHLESKGHRFYTESDTETIVHSYEEWGDDSPSHLNGMFAFAIWDSNKKKLFLARDRFGKKPLYYAIRDGILLFASELKGLLEYEGMRGPIDYNALDLYFTYGYIPSPLTIFEGVYKLPPGCSASYEDGKFSTREYWDFTPKPDRSMTEDAAIERLYLAAKDAVKIRMRSDVPLGAFLSGGVDSSAIVALMCAQSDTPVKTVSIGFNDALSELAYSRKVAEHLQTDHKEFIVTPDSYKMLPKLVWHFDEPFADHSFIPTYYLSEVTRSRVTVALTGDGGDEMFMGYPFLVEPRIFRLYSKVPSPLRRLVLRAILAVPTTGSLRTMAYHAYAKNYGGQTPLERFVMRITMVNGAGLRKIYSRDFLQERAPSDAYSYTLNLLEKEKEAEYLDAVDYATVKGYLAEDILTKVDRMSMANSLEARCPLLDANLASVVEEMPASLKLRGGVTKYIFKKMVVAKGLVPREIAYRPKQGFGAPVQSWMTGDWKEMIGGLLDSVISKNYTGLFDGGYVKRMVDEPYLNSNKLFALAVFVTWHRIYVDREKANFEP